MIFRISKVLQSNIMCMNDYEGAGADLGQCSHISQQWQNCRTQARAWGTSISYSVAQQDCLSDSGDRDVLAQQITAANVALILEGVSQFFRSCEDQSQGMGTSIFMAHRNEVNGAAGRTKDQEADRLSILISQNIHLEGRTKYFLDQQCHKYEELHDLVVRIGSTFNGALAHELVFIIASILMAKLQDYEVINVEELDYVPQMECIFGDQGEEEPMMGGWKVHSELEDCELTRFSKRNINRLSSSLFFDSDLQIVTFRSSQLPYNLKSQLLQKFISLVCFMSENLFFSLSGSSQPESNLALYIEQLHIEEAEGRISSNRNSKRIKME